MSSVTVSPEPETEIQIPSVYLIDPDILVMANAGNPEHPLGKMFLLYGQQKWNEGFGTGLLIGLMWSSVTVISLQLLRRGFF